MAQAKIIVSLHPDDLAAIDELAYKARKNRSVFLVDKALGRDGTKLPAPASSRSLRRTDVTPIPKATKGAKK